MKISKRQLRRIIKEEKRKLLREGYPTDVMNDLLALLRQAADVAAMIDEGPVSRYDDLTGQEGHELAAALQDVWVAFGGEPGEIFK